MTYMCVEAYPGNVDIQYESNGNATLELCQNIPNVLPTNWSFRSRSNSTLLFTYRSLSHNLGKVCILKCIWLPMGNLAWRILHCTVVSDLTWRSSSNKSACSTWSWASRPTMHHTFTPKYIFLPFADRPDREKKLHLSQSGQILYGVERQSRGGDMLKQFDLSDTVQLKSSQILPGLHVRWLELLSNER